MQEDRFDKKIKKHKDELGVALDSIRVKSDQAHMYKTRLELFIRSIFPDTKGIDETNIYELTNKTLDVIREYQNSKNK